MWEKLKAFATSNAVKRALWVMLAAILSQAVVYLGGLDEVWAVILTGVLASITKSINNYLSE